MSKEQIPVKFEANNIIKKDPEVIETVSYLSGAISVIFLIDAGKRVVNIVSSLKNDKKGEQEDPKKADAKEK